MKVNILGYLPVALRHKAIKSQPLPHLSVIPLPLMLLVSELCFLGEMIFKEIDSPFQAWSFQKQITYSLS